MRPSAPPFPFAVRWSDTVYSTCPAALPGGRTRSFVHSFTRPLSPEGLASQVPRSVLALGPSVQRKEIQSGPRDAQLQGKADNSPKAGSVEGRDRSMGRGRRWEPSGDPRPASVREGFSEEEAGIALLCRACACRAPRMASAQRVLSGRFCLRGSFYAPKVQAQRRKTPPPAPLGSVSFGFRLLGGLMFSQRHLNEDISSDASPHGADHSRSMRAHSTPSRTDLSRPWPSHCALRASVSSSVG